jgi:hypothetical protein
MDLLDWRPCRIMAATCAEGMRGVIKFLKNIFGLNQKKRRNIEKCRKRLECI